MATNTLQHVSPLSNNMRRNSEETYEEVKNLIRKEVWRVVGKYGGDFDDLMAEASTIYMAAYDSFDPASGSRFTTWLSNNLRWGLLDRVGERVRHNQRTSPVDEQQLSKEYRDWSPPDLLDELNEDAKLVVMLVIDTPEEIARIYTSKGGQPRNFRSTLRDHLAELGWTTARIAESFAEIRQALKN